MLLKSVQLYAVHVNENNLHQLFPLIKEQAEHHDCKFNSKDGDIISRTNYYMMNTNSGPRAFFIYDINREDPIAYALYYSNVSKHGHGYHLEDICVTNNLRGSGGGYFAFCYLAKLADRDNCDYVTWVSMASNHRTLDFYKRRIQAEPISNYMYELNPQIKMEMENINDSLQTRILSHKDMLKISNHYADEGIALFKSCNSMKSGQMAVGVFDNNREIVSITLGSINYSSFRAVLGYETEPPIFFTHNAEKQLDAVEATINFVKQKIKTSELAGHLFCGASIHDDITNYYLSSKGKQLCMTDDPKSRLDPYIINKPRLIELKDEYENFFVLSQTYQRTCQQKLQLHHQVRGY